MIHPVVPGGPLQHLKEAITGARGTPDASGPAVFVDGVKVPQGDRASGRAAVIQTTNDKTFAEALSRVDVDYLHIYECRAADLSPLTAHTRLTGLSLEWANKVTDLDGLTALPGLTALCLVDVSKVRDLTPVGRLATLEGLILAGSMTTDMRVDSLAPIAELGALRELAVMSTRVDDPMGPRPLAGCTALRDLWLPNTFKTADYAYLAARMPNTACARFNGYERLERPLNGKTVMVTGSRKPFLTLPQDAEKAARYDAAFESLKAGFAADV